MSKILFRLRHVPDDEAEEVRNLLDENGIGFFETSPGNWGISMPAIWVNEDTDYERARLLLDAYQKERSQRVKEEYELSRERGEAKTTWQAFLESPLKFISYMGLIGIVLYLSLRFFVRF